ncbi:MAG: glucose-1-phosphate adenylyltransferase subunit GlgD [Clostridiales bacterium]|jgi:glucose-1-phosphate adenylyltransferase|nr:glucose-1-phosphate adenylyltransferase subunit GlgD [Clostridiales bacterium]
MKILGIVFSNIHDKAIAELTHHRSQGSVPFGGRYRMVDFVLSNMVNSGVTKVGVITKNKYQSLMDHIGSGKHWDLSRKNGGVIFLPPYGAEENNLLYNNRLEALKGALGFLKHSTEDYVVMSDCDAVCVMDYNEVAERHIARNADITVVSSRAELFTESGFARIVFETDGSSRVQRVDISPKLKGMRNLYLNVIFLSRAFLIRLLEEASVFGYSSFSRDILKNNAKNYKIYAYDYTGYHAVIESLETYYRSNMDLLVKEKRDMLFKRKGFPIYTKVRDSAPTRFSGGGRAGNSLIADGCVIEGEAENSVIFRGVKIGAGARVKNSILMQDAVISRNADLTCVIADKNVFVKEKRVLAGCESLPYYISKNAIL